MSLSPLDELARRYGIALSYHGLDGQPYLVPEETKEGILSALGIDITTEDAVAESLAEAAGLEPAVMRAAPGTRCYLPDWLEREPAWGISLQLYELRSRRNWGIGDFADLAAFCEIAGAAGADFVGTNPLHALFTAEPQRCSPFSPSNRLFLNVLYIAVDQVPGYAASLVDPDEIRRLRETDLVDYDGVARLKLGVLRRLWPLWPDSPDQPEPYSRAEFNRFHEQGGKPLRLHAIFGTLSAHMAAAGHGAGWRGWPTPYQHIDSAEVAAFAAEHADEVEFHIWLQWLARVQLAQAAEAAKNAGLRIGLYLDFAVGEVPDGSASWSDREIAVRGMSIGAPPDYFSANGQDWGLAPPSPRALARADCALYRRTMDAAMQDAGALRIDHAMALWRLFFVPEGGVPADGAYVHYTIEALLAVLAECSNAHRTVLIGEDLGVVPEGFREVMAEIGILSYRLLYFEQDGGGFIAPENYPRLALACLSTHDLPTLKGWWRGDDIDLRREHGLIDQAAAAAQFSDRREKRVALVRALVSAGALARDEEMAALAAAAKQDRELPGALAIAAHRFVAKTPSLLVGVRLADLTGEEKPTNLPGTVDAYPNWRPKSSVPLEGLAGTALFRVITQAVAEERPKRT